MKGDAMTTALIVTGEEQVSTLAKERAHHATKVRNLAMALTVTNAEEYAFADKQIENLATRIKQWEGERDEIVNPAKEVLKRTREFFRPAIEPLAEAVKIVKGKMQKYREDDRLRIEEEERKIRRAAEKEKKEKEDIARKKREAADLKRIRLEAAAATLKKEKDAERQAAAEEQVMAAQEKVAAAEREEEAVKQMSLPAVEVKSEVPQVENTTTRKEWKARIVDESKLPRFFLICKPNTAALDEYAREHKNKARVPGVEFYEHETVVRVGTRGKV